MQKVTSFQQLLEHAAKKYYVGKTVSAIKICNEYRKLVKIHFPKTADIEDKVFPVSYKERTLTIGVANSAWAQQVKFLEYEILAHFEQNIGPNVVKKLQIRPRKRLQAFLLDLSAGKA